MITENEQRTASIRRRTLILPALGLFFLSPFVAEFLLGDISITQIASLSFVAPLYGAGTVLIREIVRRTGRGWPTMVLLGLAYGIIEEGFITQSLFNPNYAGIHLLAPTHIAFLGMGAWWTLYVLTLHTVWSTSAPIALVEALTPKRRTEPWLSPVWLGVAALVFLLGAVANAYGTQQIFAYHASAAQLAGTLAAVVLVIVCAFTIARRPGTAAVRSAPRAAAERPARALTRALTETPSALAVGLASFAAASLFMIAVSFRNWWSVALFVALYAAAAYFISRWSRGRRWSETHRIAAAGGALLTYAWHAFTMHPVIGAADLAARIGNAVFAVIAVALIAWALRRTRRFP